MPGKLSVDGFGLTPQFAAKVQEVLQGCLKEGGHEFRISQGLRTPRTQALYYCQWANRSPDDIDAAAAKLKNAGAPWLSAIVASFRDTPRKPKWQTDALPGAGWHQWGEAADCYCYRNGVQVESGEDPAYKFYAEYAESLGLRAGFYFSKKDAGHIQLNQAGGATDIYKWSYIDATMKARFSEKPGVA